MGENKEIRVLAAYSVSSGLYDARKDIYSIIAEFIVNVIVNKGIQCFSEEKMRDELNSEYNFDLPKSIVKASIKRLGLYYDSDTRKYIVDHDFKEAHKGEATRNNESINLSNNLVKDYYEFIEAKEGKSLDEDSQKEYLKEFKNFLVDIDNSDNTRYPSLFALECNKPGSKLYQYSKYIEAIRQGAVLYVGLNYDSDVSNSKKIWRDQICLFFEPEYLFSLAGYNGEAFKNDALERKREIIRWVALSRKAC